MAYYRRHPWTEDRMDIRISALMAHLANMNRDEKKRPSPYKWQDFKFEFGEKDAKPETEARPWEDLMKVARQWLVATGGIDKRGLKN